MVVPQVLAIGVYGAAVAAGHPDIDTPDKLETFSGFLRIGAVILFFLGLGLSVMSFSTQGIAASGLAMLVLALLGMYDYLIVAKKKRQAAKESVKSAGQEYLETKKEIEKSPDKVEKVQGDKVEQKTVDQSETNVGTIDQSQKTVDQSKTVKDQRTEVKDSVVNRSDITASGGGDAPSNREPAQPSNREPAQGRSTARNESSRQPTREPSRDQEPAGEEQRRDDRGGETKYCINCGEEIDPTWNACANCGESL